VLALRTARKGSGLAAQENACVPAHERGRFRSGQTGQTVNLLALRLRWFESSPAQFLAASNASAVSSGCYGVSAGHDVAVSIFAEFSLSCAI
jgi:hypothetical protein